MPDGYEFTPLDWHPQAYRVSCQNGNGRLGSHWSYQARKSFTLKKDQARTCGGSGYVLVRYHNAILGVGFYDQNQDFVASLFPKSRAAM